MQFLEESHRLSVSEMVGFSFSVRLPHPKATVARERQSSSARWQQLRWCQPVMTPELLPRISSIGRPMRRAPLSIVPPQRRHLARLVRERSMTSYELRMKRVTSSYLEKGYWLATLMELEEDSITTRAPESERLGMAARYNHQAFYQIPPGSGNKGIDSRHAHSLSYFGSSPPRRTYSVPVCR